MELLSCPSCQLRHRPRPDGCCPRCGAIVGAASTAPGPGAAAPPPPSSPAPAPRPASRAAGPGACQLCGRARPTHPVEFKQNIGALVVRFHKRVAGRLCAECVGRSFRDMTLITFLAGWWGIVSFFVTPFILIGNVVQYLGARSAFARPTARVPAGMPVTARPIRPGDAVGAPGVAAGDPDGDADTGTAPPSTTLAVTSLGLALLGLVCFGFAGLVPLAAISVGVVALYRVSRSPERYGGRGLALAGVAIGSVGLAIAVVSWGLALLSLQNAPVQPGEAEFTAANRMIDRYAEHEAFGNSSEALEIATRFGRLLKTVDSVAFKRKDGAARPSGERHFLTYVELRQDAVCFLVHVPELKDYDGEVRRTLLELAWTTAQAATRELRQPRDLRLGVGLRGELLYGALATGMGEGTPIQDLGTAVSVKPLHVFFAGPARRSPAPGAAPPAEAPPAPR